MIEEGFWERFYRVELRNNDIKNIFIHFFT